MENVWHIAVIVLLVAAVLRFEMPFYFRCYFREKRVYVNSLFAETESKVKEGEYDKLER